MDKELFKEKVKEATYYKNKKESKMEQYVREMNEKIRQCKRFINEVIADSEVMSEPGKDHHAVRIEITTFFEGTADECLIYCEAFYDSFALLKNR